MARVRQGNSGVGRSLLMISLPSLPSSANVLKGFNHELANFQKVSLLSNLNGEFVLLHITVITYKTINCIAILKIITKIVENSRMYCQSDWIITKFVLIHYYYMFKKNFKHII